MAAQLTERPASIGTFFKSGSPSLAESLGTSSLDFLLVDRQHTAVDLETVEAIARAAALHGLPVVVRLATAESEFVNNVLDAGARALVIPQVEDVDAVRAVREAARYDGTRSLSTGTRAGDFGARDREEYVEWVNEELGIVPLIESAAAVERAPELAGTEGVAALMIGPTDLSLSLGVSKDDERLRAAVDSVVAAARDAGCGVGIYAESPEELAAYREEMSFVVYGSDTGLVASAIDRAVDR
jgi:4-hydroxy-2-oxoheptanedioate aldolase